MKKNNHKNVLTYRQLPDCWAEIKKTLNQCQLVRFWPLNCGKGFSISIRRYRIDRELNGAFKRKVQKLNQNNLICKSWPQAEEIK
jgi:hypothetical protein